MTLIGLGGLGSHLLMDMAATGIGHVRALEFDTVELSNLNRRILYDDAPRRGGRVTCTPVAAGRPSRAPSRSAAG